MEPILKSQAITDKSWLVTMKGLYDGPFTTFPGVISVVVYLPNEITPAEWFIDEASVTKCMSDSNISFSPIALLGFWPVGIKT